MVTWQDIKRAANEVGVKEGDNLLVHSSFKSLGETENGADTVIKGLLAAVGEEGTLIFPTLCQNNSARSPRLRFPLPSADGCKKRGNLLFACRLQLDIAGNV